MTPTAAAEPVLLVDDIGPVRRLTMNRPDALNALNGELLDAMSEAVREAGRDDSVSVVIVRGAGRAFCAGYDLNEDAEGGEHDARYWHEELALSTERMLELTDCPKPTIAQVHSYCLAGGTDLMLACDLAVVADDAKFGYVDIRFGSGVVSMFLPWVVGVRRAKEMLFTGEDRVSADEALRIGMVNRVVPSDELADGDARARERDREERAVRDPDDEARGEPGVGRRRLPRSDGVEHRARRDDRDGEPSGARRVPPHHAGTGPQGRDRVA